MRADALSLCVVCVMGDFEGIPYELGAVLHVLIYIVELSYGIGGKGEGLGEE